MGDSRTPLLTSVIQKNSQYFHDATGEVEEAYLKLAKEVRDEC